MAANYQNQYEAQQPTDEYGKVTHRATDQHGNPVHHPGGGATTGAYGTTGGVPVAAGHHGKEQPKEGGGLSGMLHRSGSASSSSSEDDGEGGRRKKKGLKEKIKKMPGHNDEQSPGSATTVPYDVRGGEDKGMMEKIKEKLPGNRH